MEDLAVEGDGGERGGGPFTVGPPVDEFRLRDRKGDVERRGSPGDFQEKALQALYVGPV